MIINLAEKFETKLDNRFTQRSMTDAYIGKDYSWEGVNSIKVWSLEAAELNDYDSTASANRFGTPSEVEDELNVYTLKQKKGFVKVFDATHVQDQMFVKRAVSYLKQMWDERYVPAIDSYRLHTWAEGAGLGKVGSALTKSNVIEAILMANAEMSDANVPLEGRAIFMRNDVAVHCKLADELKNQQNWVDKTVIKGKIAEIDGAPVIAVPKSRMPEGVEFIVKYKNSSADPMKMRMMRANDEAPGYAGTLMEGLVRYDSFVMAHKADGIFVYGTADKVVAAPEISVDGGQATITGNGTIYYTTDGSNPKTNTEGRKVYSTAFAAPAGTKIHAYAEVEGKLHSAIAAHKA